MNFYFEVLMAKHGNAFGMHLKILFLVEPCKRMHSVLHYLQACWCRRWLSAWDSGVVVVVHCLRKNMHNSSTAC